MKARELFARVARPNKSGPESRCIGMFRKLID
jgi:hypothetical protein